MLLQAKRFLDFPERVCNGVTKPGDGTHGVLLII
jgi:hypothetical protein